MGHGLLSRRAGVLLLGLLALGVLGAGEAAAAMRQGDVVTVEPGEVVDDDLYVAAREVRVLGTVTGDLLVVARELEVTGSVGGSLMAMAAEIRVGGVVGGSLRAAANELALTGRVGRDALIAAGELQVAPGAQVARDAFVAAGQAQLQGEVGRDVHAAAGQLTLAGPVGGDVEAQVDRLQVQQGASVAGGLRYTSDNPAEVATGARVVGPVERLESPEREGGVGWWVYLWLRSLVALMALGLVLVLVSPRFAARAPDVLRQYPWQSLAWGALLLLGVPVLAVLVLAVGAVVGGWWLGLVVLGLYALALALSFPVVGLWLGRWLLERFGRTGVHLALALLVGLVLLTLVRRVPVLGGLVILATLLFGLGAMLLAALRLRHPLGAATPA